MVECAVYACVQASLKADYDALDASLKADKWSPNYVTPALLAQSVLI